MYWMYNIFQRTALILWMNFIVDKEQEDSPILYSN